MADKVITPANVLASAGAKTDSGIANIGVDIEAGDLVAVNDPYGTIILFDANAAYPASNLAGVALNKARAGQPVTYATSDPDFTPGFTGAVNETIIGSGTPGQMCPNADNTVGWYKTVLGVMTSATKMNLSPIRSGVATPAP